MINNGQSDRDSMDSDSTVKATVQADPLYLYYRLFTVGIGIPSKQPILPGNRYVGRIRAKSVAPPQTASLIKRHIFKIEDIIYDPQSTLYLSKSCRSPLDDGKRVSISPGSVGTTPEDPLELIITTYTGRAQIETVSMMPEYIYYSLYTEDGDITPKHPINCGGDDSHSVARIDNYLVPPPHSPDSIIRCISYVEGFSYCVWHRLFIDVASESPINYRAEWIPESGGPGSTPDTPLIFVKFAATRQSIGPMPYYTYITVYSARTKSAESFRVPFPLYTDGVVCREILQRPRFPGQYVDVYRVYNDAGVHGFVIKDEAVLSY